jgi:hypothetical protein
MIFDWYNGGDWGGLPVRRLGHIMADVINAADEVYRLIKVGLPLGGTNPLSPLRFKKGPSTLDIITLLGTGVDADPAWFDDQPIGGSTEPSWIGDPMRYNYRAALAMFETLCEAQTEDLPQFLQDDYESALTMEYLGLGDFDEDSLTRPQQVDAWAAIREAFGKLRFYRGRIKLLTPQAGGGSVGGIGTSKDAVNAALVTLWGGTSYSADTPRNYVQSYIYASLVAFGARAVSLNDDDSFEVLMRGTDDLNSTPFNRPVMRSYLKFVGAIGYDMDFTTDLGNLSDSFDDDFGYAVESVTFESTITRPYYFIDEFPDSGQQLLGARAKMDATCHAVWDIDAEDYPS